MAALSMKDLSPALAVSITAPKTSGRSKGEIALSKISIAWKGNSLDAARTAAFEVGKLAAGGMLAYRKADEFWKRRFDVQLVDANWWSTVHESFQSGRSSLVTMNDLLEQYFPVAANDNELFEPTVFEWEDPTEIPVRDWIYGKHLIRPGGSPSDDQAIAKGDARRSSSWRASPSQSRGHQTPAWRCARHWSKKRCGYGNCRGSRGSAHRHVRAGSSFA